MLDKYDNDQSQWEEKAKEELADHCMRTRVDPADEVQYTSFSKRGYRCGACT